MRSEAVHEIGQKESLTDEDQREIVASLRKAFRRIARGMSIASTRLAKLTAEAFRQEFPPLKPDNRLANALARGIPVREKLLEAEGGSLSAGEAAKRLGISKQAVLKRYQKGQLIGWRAERQKAVRFPVWQFEDHKVLNGLSETLKVLDAGSRLDDHGRMLFFLSNIGFLGRERPLDCLRSGQVKKVLQAAEGYGG